MENQNNNSAKLDPTIITIIAGIVFGGLIFLIASCSFGYTILGSVIGLITAIFFNSVLLPHKPHDR